MINEDKTFTGKIIRTASDLRQLEHHFTDPDLQLEGINVVSFNDSYTLEKRLQSKYLAFLIPELRKTNGSKYPYKTLKRDCRFGTTGDSAPRNRKIFCNASSQRN